MPSYRPAASEPGKSMVADSMENGATASNDLMPTSKSETRTAQSNKSAPRGPLGCLLNALTRKKPLDGRTDTSLDRCLNLIDLTSLGVGSTLGLGLYVLAGQVASTKAGPAVILSFGLAALASAFSALCYAEFAGRVPRAGSAYVYSYITVGEFVAFIIGWNLILEYVIGASSVARGFSGYLRLVCEHIVQGLSQPGVDLPSLDLSQNLSQATTALVNSTGASLAGLDGAQLLTGLKEGAASASTLDAVANYVVRYFDWPSIAIVVVITAFILFGVKESTNATLLFTGVNLIVVTTVFLSSFGHLDFHNWQLKPEELPPGGAYGRGGFMPFGWSGVLAGSATCFFGFIGFDTIASSAEEATNPKRNLPLSIILSLFISFIAYMMVAIVQTLLWPYYDQDKITILPYIFGKLGLPITYWIVLIGAVSGLASSQLGGMYPLPRIFYSMAQDKLIYSTLAHVNKRLKLPVRATIVGSVFVAVLACLLDIQDLADMVSIGTLAAYSLVSISVLLVRYELRTETFDDTTLLNGPDLAFTDTTAIVYDDGQARTNSNIQKRKPQPEIMDFDEAMSKPAQKRAQMADSWLASKMHGAVLETKDDSNVKANSRRDRRLLDLLITWNSDDEVGNNQPSESSCFQSKILIALIVILSILIDMIVLGLLGAGKQATDDQQHALVRMINGQQYVSTEAVLGSSGCIVLVTLLAVMLMLSRLPTSKPSHPDMFLVPFVPIVPTLSVLVNTFLMLNLSYLTWIRFTVWMAAGLFIYFTYGIWHSEGYMLKIMPVNKK